MCYWTDDGQDDQTADLVRGGPNGDLSLAVARLNFFVYGASAQRYAEVVRRPRVDEYP